MALALLLGIGSGTGLACLAGARRTLSAFDRVARATVLPDVNTGHGLPPAEAEAVARRFQGVRRHKTVVGFVGSVAGLDPTLFKYFIGSVSDGADVAAPVLRSGRTPRPDRADEVLLTGRAVDAAGIVPGDQLTLRLFATDLSDSVTRRVTVVGTARDLDVAADQSQDRSSVRLTPAFTAANAERLQAWSATALVAEPDTDVERDLLPQLRAAGWQVDETRTAAQSRVQEALHPLVTTLALLGGFFLLATVVVVGQGLVRQSDASGSERMAGRALGLTPSQLRVVDLASTLSVAVPGIMAGLVLAVVLSPLFPVGSLRPLDPGRGLTVDLTVLGLGAGAMLVLLLVGNLLAARWSDRPGRLAATPRAVLAAASRPVASTGLALALGATSAARRRYWTTVVTSAVALSLVVAAVGFVAALDRLSSEPVRYGVGWELTARNAYGEVPPDRVRRLFEKDPDITAVSGASVAALLVNGEETVPGLAVLPITGELWPTLVEGSLPRNDTEIVVGAATLDALDAGIGDTVEVAAPFFSPAGARLRIVGTAVFPSIDLAGVDPTRLDNGVALTWARYQSLQAGADVGDQMPDITLIDLAGGVDPQSVIERYPDGVPEVRGFAPTEWLTSLAPLEVAETDRASGFIWTLVVLLAITVAATIGHGLAAVVRRRRGDYAVLKALGFTRRQVGEAVLWQSMAVAVLALMLALPVGAALGSWSWGAFARLLGVVDTPVLPVAGLVGVAAGSLLVAGALACIPGVIAGRISPAAALRHE